MKNFIICGEKIPKLIFVSDGLRNNHFYIDGKLVKGIKSLQINTSVDESTAHIIEYVTCMCENK